ncbi:unnamed protein product [Prunus armeniaca]
MELTVLMELTDQEWGLIHGSFELDACWWLASPNPLFRSPLSVLMDLPLLATKAEQVAAAAA